MCKKLEGSGSKKVVFWTIEPPFEKGRPGFVHQSCVQGTGPIVFTGDLWFAYSCERAGASTILESINARSDKAVYTHDAVCQLVTGE